MTRTIYIVVFIICAVTPTSGAWSQEKSVNPGINDSFRDPDVQEFIGRFEVESRELFSRRHEIAAACQIKSGQTVADIGAGTGLFTRLFSDAVGKDGRVIAVEISQKFLDHIQATSREAAQRNVDTLLATADSTGLPPKSVDVAFICDTYHHFEFPLKTMASLKRALKPGGRVVLVDFRRIPGTSSDWVLNHVRAGQEVFEAEIIKSGFEKVEEEPDLLRENYFVVFQKSMADEPAPAQGPPRGIGRGRGPGFGRGRGPGAAMRADQAVFHYLLGHHVDIRRTVKPLDNGVETLTESDQPEIAKKIQEHVAAMHKRIEEGRGLRFWDDLFAAIFKKHASIKMTVENTDKGVRVKETSDDPTVVALIQAHADVVSQFVARGFEEAHVNHRVPSTAVVKPRPSSEATKK
jgi:SAM-dependent methyltransferase